MDGGWIKLYRAMTAWEWYDDNNVKVAFLHLLLTANYEEKRWRGVTIKPGQRVTSFVHFAKEIHLSVQQTRTAIQKLESTGEITRESTNGFTLITIVKWAEYQRLDDLPTRQITNEQQTDNKRITSTKEIQEGKERKNSDSEATVVARTPRDEAEDFFQKAETQELMIQTLIQEGGRELILREQIPRFVGYWTELNATGKKQRWQMQKTFEVRRRIATWLSRVREEPSKQYGVREQKQKELTQEQILFYEEHGFFQTN